MTPNHSFAAAVLLLAANLASAAVSTSPKAEGYRGIWFTLGQKSEYGDKYSGGLGTYTANHNPMAVYSAKVEKTFFVYGGTATGERKLQCLIGSYDHKTGEVSRPVIVYDKSPVGDPHDNPSLNLDSEGYIWVFVSGRSTLRPGFIYRSTAPYDLMKFERIAEKTITYPQPWYVPGKGFLHMFTQYTNGRELYWETSADGRNWSSPRKLAGLGGHYQTSAAVGSKIASFFNYHPGGEVDKRTNLYYAESTDFGTTWTTASGTPLEVPLTAIDNPALVRDYASEGRLLYTCDLNFDSAGNPILLYVLSRDHRPGPQGGKREWTVAHWKSGKWNFSTITTSDHNYDMGSLYVTASEWLVLGPTDTGPQKWGAGGEMVLWSTKDEGKTWERRQTVTNGSKYNHSYARRPLNARDPFFAFWADGDPREPSPSHLFFSDSSGTKVWRLPYSFPSGATTARPEPVSP